MLVGLRRSLASVPNRKSVRSRHHGGSARIDGQTARVLRCHKHPLLRSNFGRRTLEVDLLYYVNVRRIGLLVWSEAVRSPAQYRSAAVHSLNELALAVPG